MTKIYIGTFQVKASFYRSMSQYLWSTSRFRSVTNSISRYRLVSDTLVSSLQIPQVPPKIRKGGLCHRRLTIPRIFHNVPQPR